MTRGLFALGRLLRWFVVLVLSLGVVALVGLLGLAWRVSQSPLDLAWAAHRVEAAVNRPGAHRQLLIGGADLEWAGFHNAAARGLQLHLRDVRVLDRDSNHVVSAGTIQLTVSMARLLGGEVVPRTVVAHDVDLLLVRDAAGNVALDLDASPDSVPGVTLVESIAELAGPVRSDDAPAPPALRHLEQLRSLVLTDSNLTIQDAGRLTPWRIAVASLDLRRQNGGGVEGAANATMTLAGLHAGARIDAHLAPDGGTQIEVRLSPLDAATADRVVPGIGAGNQLDATVQASGTLKLSPALLPEHVTLHAESGTGSLRLAGSQIALENLAFDADASWDQPAWAAPGQLVLPKLRAVITAPGGAWPTTLTGAANLSRADSGRINGEANVSLDHLAFADIGAVWPAALGGHVRPWLTENLTSGTARDGTFSAAFNIAPDGSSPVFTRMNGSLSGDDATIHWLRPVPPVEHAQAMLTIQDPDTLDIAITAGRQGLFAVSRGLIRITGLSVKDQFLALETDVAGPVPDLLTLLRHPRLHLLDNKPLPIRGAGGAVAGRLSVNLPLEEHLQFDQVRIAASGRATDLRLLGLVAGRNIERGDIAFDVTPEAMQAKGDAQLAGIQAKVAVDLDFKAGGPAQILTHAEAVAPRATPKQLAAAGIDLGGIVPSGTAGLTTRYTQRRDGTSDVQVNADLRDAALSFAGWRKQPGQATDVAAHLVLRNDHLALVDGIEAAGPGLTVQGHVEMVGGRLLNLVLENLVLGNTRAVGRVRLPDVPAQPIRATLSGPVLDLSAQLGKPDASPSAEPDPPWIADVRFDRILLARDRGLPDVTAHAEHDGRRLSTLDATSTGPERVDLHLRPDGARRKLTITAADGGALLRDVDLLDTVDGGRLSLDAAFDDTKPGSPLAGAAELTNFRVSKAPALGKLLQTLTVYGAVEALSGPGLSFLQLTLPFRYVGSVLEVTDARAFSASLGLTARGRLDTARNTLDVQGTVVPAYAINAALGHIPLLGRLFSAERGGGLVALNYALRGPAANPTVTVNPLSALTPGFLRGLFHILE